MKFSFTFKTPDVTDSISKYDVEDYMKENPDIEDSAEALANIKSFLDMWIKYGEYVTVEFDTVDETAVVFKSK